YVTAVFRDPTAPTTVLTSPHAEITFSRRIPVVWSSEDTGSGVASHDLRVRWASIDEALPDYERAGYLLTGLTGPSFAMRTSSGTTYCLEARANDAAGNVGEWTPEACTSTP